MLTWVPRIFVFTLVLCAACGAETAEEAVSPEPETQQTADPVEEPPEDEELPNDEASLEVDVDEMDEHALEAACFAGQQAACDQLGH